MKNNSVENLPCKTPIAELAVKAREHYEEASAAISHSSSLIRQAIDLWEETELKAERKIRHDTGNEVEDDFQNFWKEIIIDENGNVNLEQVKKELFDFHRLMRHSGEVNCHFANLSNYGYDAEVIINEGERLIEERIDDAVRDVLENE